MRCSRRVFTPPTSLPDSSRGTEPPVSPVLAPCGSTAVPASKHASTTATASRSVPGLTTATARPLPMRAPLVYTAAWLPCSTCSCPTTPCSLPISDCSSALQHEGHPAASRGLRCLSSAIPAPTITKVNNPPKITRFIPFNKTTTTTSTKHSQSSKIQTNEKF